MPMAAVTSGSAVDSPERRAFVAVFNKAFEKVSRGADVTDVPDYDAQEWHTYEVSYAVDIHADALITFLSVRQDPQQYALQKAVMLAAQKARYPDRLVCMDMDLFWLRGSSVSGFRCRNCSQSTCATIHAVRSTEEVAAAVASHLERCHGACFVRVCNCCCTLLWRLCDSVSATTCRMFP
jgi:hypothetical protein